MGQQTPGIGTRLQRTRMALCTRAMSILKGRKNSPRHASHGSPLCPAERGSRSLLRGEVSQKNVRHFIADATLIRIRYATYLISYIYNGINKIKKTKYKFIPLFKTNQSL